MARKIPMRRRTGVTDTTYPAAGVRAISPTDIAQYIRMEQCERYLRLRLHERAHGPRFLTDYGVAAQPIPPLGRALRGPRRGGQRGALPLGRPRRVGPIEQDPAPTRQCARRRRRARARPRRDTGPVPGAATDRGGGLADARRRRCAAPVTRR